MDEIVKMENNKNVKRMIFHVPFPLDENPTLASRLRPEKMLSAFRLMGYSVDIISGNAKERKILIKRVLENLKQGVEYNFCYSESSTVPTALTQKGRLIPRIFLDFNFFKNLKKNKIPLLLFYRDIYWMFEQYQKDSSFIKRIVSKMFYKYDLYNYNKYLNVLFVPSEKMSKYFSSRVKDLKIVSLPPGLETNICNVKNEYKNDDKRINLIYVGGLLPPFYDIKKMVEIVKENPHLHFTIICRKDEYIKSNNYYNMENISNIKILHVSGEAMKEEMRKSDIFVIYREMNEYLTFAMPYKFFESLSFYLPVITNEDSAIADFIIENNIGWVVNDDNVNEILDKIFQDKSIIVKKREKIKKTLPNNTWISRSKKVVQEAQLILEKNNKVNI